MDKESLYELQKIDCNCNDCAYMVRDVEKFESKAWLYGRDKKASYRINYGHCNKFQKEVTFIPNTCQPQTQDCFIHRKDVK